MAANEHIDDSNDSVLDGPVMLWRDARAILAESLWWSDGVLHWCDITAGTLHRSPEGGAADGSDDVVLRFPAPLASFQPRRGGGFVVALEDSVIVCDEEGGSRRTIAEIAHAHPGMRLNEGKADPEGRFQIGSMDVTRDDPDAAVYLVDERGARSVRGGFTTTNGFEWAPEQGIAFLADTGTQTLYRAAWDADQGPGELVPFATGRMFDGAALDVDGHLWVGLNGEGRVVRIDPSGRIVLEFEVPARNVTSVAFGGEGLGTLFIASARENLTEEQLQEQPGSGGIFAVVTRTHGMPVRAFGG